MTRVIAIINQKGGSGKTTTAVNLGAYLAVFKKRVLVLDLDPQANTTIHLGLKPHTIDKSIYGVMTDKIDIATVIKETPINNLYICPANINLSGVEIELAGVVGREMVLKDSLNKIIDEYDFIIIDCPPSLSLLTINALTVAEEIIIPVQTEFFALEGMGKLMNTVDIIKKRLNRKLKITGILPTMFDGRTNLSREVIDKIKEYFGDKVYQTKIRKNIKLAEASSHGKPIFLYDPKSSGAEDYESFSKEVNND
ncbi:MAG: AAA family ATPase [Candidatus Dadabacteria bacterium]|nr:AAA family ATPase [Candidatus Dadabacteria bacterium]NIT14800.1 AAA family ATPase [Candidatus Dadabacteria bacterium]